MGETKYPHFYDFGILGRVQTPQIQLCLSLETPGYLQKQEKPWDIFKQIRFINLKMLKIPKIANFEKTRAGNDEDPLHKILKIVDMGSIFSRKHEM